MTRRNKYAKRSKISVAQFREFIRLFAYDLTATQISQVTGLNRNTVNRYLCALRERIARICEQESPFSGVVEVDESFFGPRRQRGVRGRGALGKTIVFGLFQRNGKVYTEIVPNCAQATLRAVIRGRVDLRSVIHSDGWRGYNGLVDMGYKKHLRVDHQHNEFARGKVHLNGIEGFWGYAKSRLSRFRGLRRTTFYLHLKECEFRFNNRSNDLYRVLLNMLRNKPLF